MAPLRGFKWFVLTALSWEVLKKLSVHRNFKERIACLRARVRTSGLFKTETQVLVLQFIIERFLGINIIHVKQCVRIFSVNQIVYYIAVIVKNHLLSGKFGIKDIQESNVKTSLFYFIIYISRSKDRKKIM